MSLRQRLGRCAKLSLLAELLWLLLSLARLVRFRAAVLALRRRAGAVPDRESIFFDLDEIHAVAGLQSKLFSYINGKSYTAVEGNR